MLTPEEINSYKNRLEEEKVKLIGDLEKDSTPTNFGEGDASDREDEEADEAEELGNKLAATPLLRERVQRIEEALQRIESGEYGKCKKCGGEISKEVLDLVPESYLCEKCK